MGYFWFTKKFNRNIHNKNYNNVQNEKKQKQTKNRAKINEKIPMKKKDHLPYTNIVGKKRKKKSNGIDSVQPQKSMSTYLFRPITFVLWDWSLNNRFLRERGMAHKGLISPKRFTNLLLWSISLFWTKWVHCIYMGPLESLRPQKVMMNWQKCSNS